MSKYKYPYIPKDYYPAVMLACKIIREDGTFNKAINSAVKYYGVDKDELIKHVRARQGAGQRGKSRGKYKYYAVGFFTASDHYTGFTSTFKKYTNQFKVVKATNRKNAEKQIYEKYDSWGSKSFAFIQYLEEVDNKDKAEKLICAWKQEVAEMNKPPTKEQEGAESED